MVSKFSTGFTNESILSVIRCSHTYPDDCVFGHFFTLPVEKESSGLFLLGITHLNRCLGVIESVSDLSGSDRKFNINLV